jgi:tripartite-type tricarboxylate transporter receptor subunit TctC
MTARRRSITLALCALTLALAGAARAQDNYPTKPIRLVVGFASGGITDVIARAIANKMTQDLGQTVYVENKPGAGTTLAADVVAKSPPDGYTLLLQDVTTHAINASLYPKLPYDTVKDFSPVSMVASTPLMLVVNSNSSAKTAKELLALLKTKGGAGTYGSSGNGTIIHLSGAMLNAAGKVEPVHIPYKGSAPATQALLAGDIDYFFSSLPPALAQVQAGKLRALGVTTPKRVPSAPDVPTMIEAGIPNFEVVLYNGIMGPAGMPAGVVAKLNAEIRKALASPELKTAYQTLGAEAVTTTPAEFTQMLTRDMAHYAPIVKASGAKVD